MAAGLAVAAVIADVSISPHAAGARYRYDGEQRLISRSGRDGRVIRYGYSNAGLLTSVSYHRVGGLTGLAYPASSRVRFEYDPAGNRTAMHGALGTTQYRYDDAGRLSAVTSPGGKTVSYEYDAWHRVRALQLPSGERTEYAYDILDNITRVSSAAGTIEYRHDPDRVTRTLPNGIATVFDHVSGQMRSITHRSRDGSLIAAYRFEYGVDDRITSQQETTAEGTLNTDYVYDMVGRLSRATQSNGVDIRYEYDALGNRVLESSPNATTRYAYDAFGRLERAGARTFSYDAEGNLVSKRDPAGETAYAYDHENRLTTVRTAGRTIKYDYDGDGRRIRRAVDGRTTWYVHDVLATTPQVAAEYPQEGAATSYLVGASRLGLRRADGTVAYFLEGHLGSVRAVVDEQGAVIARYAYSPFGVPTQVAGSEQGTFLFAGEQWDPDAALIALGPRHYDPAVGRFLSRDPFPGELSDPQTLNAYTYSRNDPVNLVDPTGLRAQWWQPPPPPPFYQDPARRAGSASRVATPGTPKAPAPPTFREFVNHLGRGEPFGTRLGENAARFYADRYVASGNPLYVVPGVIASAWTPETWKGTAATLAGPALARAAAATASKLGTQLLVRSLGMPTRGEPFHLPLLGKLMHYGVDTRFGPHIGLFERGGRSLVHIRATHVNIGGRAGVDIPLAHAVGAAWAGWQQASGLATQWLDDMRGRETSPGANGLTDDNRRPAFLPPPPPGGGGGAVPAVGGVYLDQVARILGDVGTIAGAMYHAESGALVLVGEKRTAMPPVKPEYLAAAVRAVFTDSPHEPGMTIDPHPQNPHGPTMVVRFFGNTANTRLGWVMFEADRLMKGYSVGVDNVSKQPIVSAVPGYRSVTAMSLADPGGDRGLWSRFWLVPDPVIGRISSDGRAVVFDPLTMRVKTETMRWSGDKLVPAGGARDRHAEQFAGHFSTHYADFAREHAVYAELTQVAQVIALAMWMKERDVPIHWNMVRAFTGDSLATPETTPAARARQQRTSPDGHTLIVEAFGGVAPPSLELTTDARGARFETVIADAFTNARQRDRWSFPLRFEDTEYQAAVIPPPHHRESRGYDLVETDLGIPDEFRGFPGASRRYSSFHDEPSEFGRSWTWALPRIEFEASAGKREYVSVEGAPSTRTLAQRFALTDALGLGHARFDRHFVDQQLHRIGFAPSDGTTLVRALYPEDGLYRLFYANGAEAVFDGRGRLRAMFAGERKAAYAWDATDRLVTVHFESGRGSQTVHLEYDGSRVKTATLGPQTVRYAYDDQGNLASAGMGNRAVTYRYDASRLLVQVTTAGQPVVENRYDALGHLLEQRRGGVRVALPTPVREATAAAPHRTYDAHGRLASIDDGGYSERHRYDATGHLAGIDVVLPTGGRAAVAIAPNPPRIVIEDPRGVKVELRYDEQGRLLETLADGQPNERYVYDRRGNLVEVVYGTGGTDRFSYTPDGEVERWQRSSGNDEDVLKLLYDGDGEPAGIAHRAIGERRWTRTAGRVTFVESGRVVRYAYDEHNRPERADSSDGTSATYTYSSDNTLRSVEIARKGATAAWRVLDATTVVSTAFDNASTRYLLGGNGVLMAVEDPYAVLTTYAYDSADRLTRVGTTGGACREYAYDTGSGLVVEERLVRCDPVASPASRRHQANGASPASLGR